MSFKGYTIIDYRGTLKKLLLILSKNTLNWSVKTLNGNVSWWTIWKSEALYARFRQ